MFLTMQSSEICDQKYRCSTTLDLDPLQWQFLNFRIICSISAMIQDGLI